MQYVRAKLSNAQITMNGIRPQEDHTKLYGDALDIGYTLGAMYEYSDNTRFGIGYRSQIKHKLKGNIDFSKAVDMDQNISARLTTPANLTFGAYHDINDQWSVMAEFGRTYWSSFKELRILGQNGIDSITQEKWKDTTFYAVGASYRYNDKWKFRAGFAARGGHAAAAEADVHREGCAAVSQHHPAEHGHHAARGGGRGVRAGGHGRGDPADHPHPTHGGCQNGVKIVTKSLLFFAKSMLYCNRLAVVYTAGY